MCRMPLWVLITLVFGISLCGAVSRAQSPQERADRVEIENFLKEWKRTSLIEDKAFDRLRALGVRRALPVLATFLPDPELGFLALHSMQQLDPEASAPYLLKNLAVLDHNIQRDTFRLANLRIEEYGLYLRAGSPAPDPATPAPRYPRATTPYPYTVALHDAAVVRLKVGDFIGAEREAIQTIGLTGDKNDLPLLHQVAQREGNPYTSFCTASLARLGERAALQQITKDLDKPVVLKPAGPVIPDGGQRIEPKPGQMVTSREDGERIRQAAWQAGFSMNKRFVPALLKHLDDPPGQFHGDYADPDPAQEVRNALARIIFGKEYGDRAFDWKHWWRAHGKVDGAKMEGAKMEGAKRVDSKELMLR